MTPRLQPLLPPPARSHAMPSRREFIEGAALAAAGLALPAVAEGRANQTPAPASPTPATSSATPPAGFLDVIRPPDRILAQTSAGDIVLANGPAERWTGDRGVTVTTSARAGALRVTLASPGAAITRLHLRWRGNLTGTPWILGDAWERAYGDLEWRGWAPDRIMPWYFALELPGATHAYGVRTGC